MTRTTVDDARLAAALVAVRLRRVAAGGAAPAPVADAAMRHDTATVRALVRQGGDVNAAQGDGMTALHWAATHGDAELAEVLLYAGANVRATSRLGRYTPLHVASQSGAGRGGAGAAGPRRRRRRGDRAPAPRALMLAAQSGHVEAVTALLDAAGRRQRGGDDPRPVGADVRRRLRPRRGRAAAGRARGHRRPDVEGRRPGGAHRSGRGRRPAAGAAGRPGRLAEPDWRRRGARRRPAARASGRRGRRHPAVPLQRAHRHPGRAVGAALRRPAGRAPRRCGRWSRPAPTSTCRAPATGPRRCSSPP